MEDCIFCKITKGEIPSRKVYEDDNFYAFEDIAPVTPVHVLVVPKNMYGVLRRLRKPIRRWPAKCSRLFRRRQKRWVLLKTAIVLFQYR